ncbi:MAG TPA: PVC-type heme-binding CxxCH protein, partial [Pirellula sp.]|nr:PVC-type heme-binding CxxCH protein [Pirellula sp.]
MNSSLNQSIQYILQLIFLLVVAFQPPSRNQLLAEEKAPITINEWSLQLVPNAWRSVQKDKLAPIGGFSWYRALVFVPQNWMNDTVSLFVESLDDARAISMNGKLVGATGTFPPQFRSGLGENGKYQVESAFIRVGEYNSVAIRVYQSDPRPNFSVAPPVLMNESKMEAIRLEGAWQYRPGDDSSWSNAKPLDFGLIANANSSDEERSSKGIYRRLDKVDDIVRYVARREGDTDPLSPKDAEKRFRAPDDLNVQLVLGDPEIAQPLFMTWDERGRMWLAEYRQYPLPAGLTMLSRDVHLRTVYDRVPPPPPNHFKGKDRISIHEDTDGDGVYDLHKTFVDGLSLATSVAVGRGGVYVTNPPYLLFYPDRNRDDIPDQDPEVLLEGFGIEDTHSVINSLRFGPDGWLYGAQGSTVTAAVRKPGSKEPPIRTVGQQIWRFHPESKVFEVYAEGGGNTFGCEIDSKGRVFSGHNGGDTRGFHYVQGGYYRKGFGKHGPLSNPHSFGFFENIKHGSVARFTHNFIIYEEGVLPERYRGRLFGIEPLQGQVVMSDIAPLKSTFETKDIERVLKTDDPWFRPVDIKCGPDGCIYIADMYEQRIDHSSHYAGRVDGTNGRIYRLRPEAISKTIANISSQPFDYSKFSIDQLSDLLNHPSRWHRQMAIRLIGDRSDSTMSNRLDLLLKSSKEQNSLEAVWALQASGGLTVAKASELLEHANPFVRAWTLRILTDSKKVNGQVAWVLAELARQDPSIEVRKQLASSAKRLGPEMALPIIAALLERDKDIEDPHQPLLIWWALEAQVGKTDVSRLIQTVLSGKDSAKRPLVAKVILERLMKRFAVTGLREDLVSAAKILSAAPDSSTAEAFLKGFEEAYQGRSLASIPDELATAIASSGGGSLALRLRQGQSDALNKALETIQDTSAKIQDRKQLIEVIG